MCELGRDSVFGEVSLYTEEPRAATVTITSDTAHVLKMTRDAYRSIMVSNNKISDEVRLKIAKEALNKNGMLHALPPAVKERLYNNMHSMKYPAGTVICKQGSHAHAFYIVTEGICGISVHAETGNLLPEITVEEHAETILLRRLYPGDCFG